MDLSLDTLSYFFDKLKILYLRVVESSTFFIIAFNPNKMRLFVLFFVVGLLPICFLANFRVGERSESFRQFLRQTLFILCLIFLYYMFLGSMCFGKTITGTIHTIFSILFTLLTIFCSAPGNLNNLLNIRSPIISQVALTLISK